MHHAPTLKQCDIAPLIRLRCLGKSSSSIVVLGFIQNSIFSALQDIGGNVVTVLNFFVPINCFSRVLSLFLLEIATTYRLFIRTSAASQLFPLSVGPAIVRCCPC